METELEAVENGMDSLSRSMMKALSCAGRYLDIIKKHIVENPPANESEEIAFFKDVKPKFNQWGVYYSERLAIIANEPPVGKQLAKYYRSLMDYYYRYFSLQAFLYQYFKRGGSEMDSLYFVRGASVRTALVPEMPEADPQFSTVGSYLFAKFMAFERLQKYLVAELKSMRVIDAPSAPGYQFTWTATKAQFIELAYALQSAGVFNNGQVDVKQVFEYLCGCFNIKVSNYYGYFQSMRIRKKDRTPFLKMLIDFVTRRMDDSDEFPRYS
ncbi:RteC domain-containing protein [Parapedobacter sp. ISTM3]|uniref:RteC domain-containing protein n=1 Tax=Parapedobacter sp. ISTM3 TaxID=2800130 RepID=UPI00190562D4|nr:RteC domain-containing protein [Parapedobacter sp. ISTM3]MBK1439813.1 RteC domain-containing protein [Parapedobacter sp. ISTM3]